jgi:choline dehydrogenase-like flavoprotein
VFRTQCNCFSYLCYVQVHYQSVLAALRSEAQAPAAPADSETDTLNVDVVVVGSGAGGGMVASELAKAGLSVLVLEKGGYFRASEFRAWRESEAFLHTFEKGGLCSTADGNVLVLAGSCVGGGSTINWSASFRTPDVVREDWVNLGLPQFG